MVTSVILLLYMKLYMFISTYDELGSMGVDFGQLLKNQVNEKSSVLSSPPVSRKNSLIASITSLSSLMTNNTSKQEPDEVKNLGIYFINYFLITNMYPVNIVIQNN